MNQHLMFSVLLHNNAEQNYIEHREFIIILKFPLMEIGAFSVLTLQVVFVILRP